MMISRRKFLKGSAAAGGALALAAAPASAVRNIHLGRSTVPMQIPKFPPFETINIVSGSRVDCTKMLYRLVIKDECSFAPIEIGANGSQ